MCRAPLRARFRSVDRSGCRRSGRRVRRARGVPENRATAHGRSAVLVAQSEFALVGRGAAGEALVQLFGPLPVVGMEQALPRADVRLDLVVGVAEHLLPARRVHDRAGFEVPVPDALLRSRERQPKPFFALAERRFCALAVRDVEVHAHDSDHGSVGLVADGKAARQHMDEMAVLVAQAELAFVGLRAPCQARRSVRSARTRSSGCSRRSQAPTCGSTSSSAYPSICFQRVEYTTAPDSRFQSHTPSCAPAKASVRRSSLSRSAASARRRAVTSRTASCTVRSAGPSTNASAISTSIVVPSGRMAIASTRDAERSSIVRSMDARITGSSSG